MSSFDPPRVGMRPRVFLWAASFAVVATCSFLVPNQHRHGDALGGSGSNIQDSDIASNYIGSAPTPLTSTGVAPTALASNVDAASQQPPAARGSSSPVIHRHNVFLYVRRSIPIHLSIPVIGVSASVVELGLNKDGSPQVPSSYYVPGWYKLDASPGQLGTAVILGHIDSVAGPGVFFRLRKLRAGDRVFVKLRDGITVQFSVIDVREYLKSQFPLKYVYGNRRYAALQLVTCGGAFDYQTHHYLSSIVVFTKLVKR